MGVCRLLLIRAVLAAVAVASAHAQSRPEGDRADAQVVHDIWTVRDGLPLNHLNGIAQDADGFLWLATFDGVARFDGVRFETRTAGTIAGLPSNRFVTISAAPDGSVWAATEFEIVHFGRQRTVVYPDLWTARAEAEPKGGVWVLSNRGLFRQRGDALARVGGHRLDDVLVWDVLRDRSGVVWVATASERLWRYDGRWREVRASFPGRVWALHQDVGGTVWAAGNGLGRWDGQAFQSVGRPSGTTVPLLGLADRGDGGLWAVSSRGLYALDPGGQALATLAETAMPSVDFTQSRGAVLTACPDGAAWATAGGGFYRNGRLAFTAGISPNALFCDREGSLWATTVGDGLHRFRSPTVTAVGPAEGVPVRNVSGMFEDRAGGVWIGDVDGHYARLHEGRVTVGHLPEPPGLTRTENVGVGIETQAGAVWLGRARCAPSDRTGDGGCRRFERFGQSDARVFAVHEDRRGTLWMGLEDGLYEVPPGGTMAAARFHATGTGGLPGATVRAFLETDDGTLWMATNGGGIARRDADTGAFRSVTRADGLSSDNVRWLTAASDGGLWVATEDRGLTHLDPATGRTTPVRAADGLYDDNIHAMLRDGQGRMWMSTNRGLFWVPEADLDAVVQGEARRVRATAYTERDGMRNREANGGFGTAALRTRDGRLWFATQDGVAIVDPRDLTTSAAPPRPVAEWVRPAGGEARRADGVARLGPGQRDFSIAYTAPTFVAPERAAFRTRLVGLDGDWRDAGTRREAFYTNVPPGRYTFRVAARTADGVWSEAAPLAVVVEPRLYETGAARLLGLLALVGLGALGVVLRERRQRRAQRRREEALEAEVARRTEALRLETERTEAQALQIRDLADARARLVADVSHELRTPLTLTLGPLADVLDGHHGPVPASFQAPLDLAHRNTSRLRRLVDQLLDAAALDAGRFQLDRQAVELGRALQRLAEPFAAAAERSGVTFRLDLPPSPVPVWVDPDSLETIVGNLLSNAVKFTPSGGRIGVRLAVAESLAVLEVADSGTGIAAEHLDRVFDRFFQAEKSERQPGSGIGLSLAKELAELHSGTLAVASVLGEGARFTLRLPLHASAAGPSPDAPTAPRTRRPDRPEPEDRPLVLVVDDSLDIRSFVRGHLEAAGYAVDEAEDGQAALDRVRQHTPDAVVSDVVMPRLDGLGLTRALRADPETDFVPVVLLSARATVEDRLAGLGVAADDYLTKPFTPAELVARIDNLIASRQRLRERFARPAPSPVLPATALPATSLPSPALEGARSTDSAFAAEVAATIEARLSEEGFGVEALAEALGVSRSSLHRRLVAAGAPSPGEALREARLQRAATLLHAEAGTVSEIAYGVGYRSVAHFSAQFKERFGASPTAFRAGGRASDDSA